MSRACVLLVFVSSMLAACSASPTSPSALNSPSAIGATSLADPTLSGTAYQLTAVTATTMSFTNNQNTLTVPYDASTTFRRAQLNLYAPSDPYLPEATAYNSAATVDASVLATFIGGNARIIVQAPPNPVRILSFQPIPTVGSGGGGPCTPGAPGCGWSTDDMRTHTQAAWGDTGSSAAALLSANFFSMYGSSLVIGGTATITFTSASAVFTFLPALGTPGVLTGNLQDPQSSSAGEFGGELLALQLNADFSSLLSNSVALGSLRICNFTLFPILNGQTVGQFLTTANQILGGGSAPFGATEATAVARLINLAFVGGTPSTFAQDSLVNGACP